MLFENFSRLCRDVEPYIEDDHKDGFYQLLQDIAIDFYACSNTLEESAAMQPNLFHIQCNSEASTNGGPPKIALRREELEYLREKGFTQHQIAQLFGVCRSTIQRRLDHFCISSKVK